jgi:hypothetical protein
MPDWSKIDLSAAIRRDYMAEGLKRDPRPARTRRPVAEEDLMLPVIYSMSVSLDGFIAGPDGDIGWTAPDAERMRFRNGKPAERTGESHRRGGRVKMSIHRY